MKGIYLVAILVVTLGIVLNGSLADIPTKCPETNQQNETVFIPHESDCTKFYSCHMGIKGKPIDCPFMDENGNKLHFNPKLQVCDWPWNAGCLTPSLNSTTTSSIPTTIITPNITISPTPTTPTPSSPTPTTATPSTSTSTTPTLSSPTPTTPTSSSPTPTTPTLSSPTSTTPTPSSPTPTTPTSSSPTPTTSTSSSPTPTTPTPSSPTTTTAIPSTLTSSSPTSTTPTPSTPSSPIPTTPTSSSPTPTTPTLSSSTSTTPTPSSPTPTTPTTSTSSSPTPTTPTPSSPTTTTAIPSTLTSSSPTPTTPTTPTPSSPTPTTPTISIPNFPTPSVDSCKSDNRTHMLPHETMCDHYYLCFNGWVSPISQKCDRNLLFNSLLRVCDYPENVNCKNSPLNTDKSNPSSISPPFNYSLPTNSDPVASSCEPNDKNYKIPHEIICDYYYWCANGIRGTNWVRCESNLLFNPVIGECDYSENVNCGHRSTLSPIVPSPTTTTPTTTTPTTTTPTTTTPTTTTPTTTTPTTTTPTTTTPTTTTPTTTTPTTTTPTTTTPTTTTPTTTTPTTTTPTTTTPTTTTPTTTTPTTTTPTTTTPTTTTPTTTTPTKTTTKEITITTPTITTETTTKNPNEPRKKCPPKGSTEEARIAHPCLCNRYYDCIDGEKILQTCPIGKHFDYMREICDWTSIVKCIRPIPTFNILTSDIDDYNTTCAPEGRAFQHDTDCSAYYLCSNGEKILRQCMEGLHFNMTIQICDYPQKSCDLNRSSPRINLDICPPSDSVQEVFLPHECECTQYYECIDGKKFLRFCPNRLHFDPVWQICNDPIEAKCIADTISTTSTSIFTTSSTTETIDEPRTTCPPKGSTEKVRLPHPCLCNQYYECVEGDKVLRTCPINMYFDDATDVCDWSIKVKCISQFSSHDIQINDYDINNKCSPNGRAFNHENSCTEYYLCSEGEKVLQYCFEGLHFNVTIQMCDYPQKKCDLSTPKPQPIHPTVTLNICPPDSMQQVLLPHECNCTQYYECIDGKQILRDCSDGLHYDYVRQICDVPIKGKCNDFTTTIPRSSFPTIPDSSKCYDENNEIPHENDCRFYYKCNNGEKILKICPRNLYFNPKLRVCDYPENVVCNVEGNIPSTSTPIKCETITETTNIPHETDCNLYYVCENGVGILKKCSPNLVFNPILKVCDFPENYVCKVTHDKNNIKKIDKIVQNLDPFTCIGTCPEEDPDYAVLLPNDDCKKFCMCSGGVAWIQSCPEPLYFDSVEKICKKKKDAVCGIRLYNQDSSFKIDKTVNNDDSLQPLTDENDDDEHETSLDPSSCIGTCFEEDPEHTVLLPNDNCKKFCLCSNGTTYVQPCPELLYFDSIDKACKRKKDAVCAVRSLMVDRIFDDNSVSLSEKDYNERELYDNPWYKRRFYNVDPSTCIGICPEEDNDYEELLPHKDCRKFCICRKGLTYVQLCPGSLYFHSVEKVCRQKRHAVCATNSFKQYHAITINREDDEDDDSMEFLREDNKRRRHNYLWPHFRNFNPTTCIGICSNSKCAVLYPHTDCKKFCLCNNGFMWIQSCPKSLYFDSIHKRCKEKKEAVCAVRTFNRKRIIVIDKQVNENKKIEVQEMNDEREIHNSWSRLHSHVSTCIGTCFDEDYDYAVLLPNLDCRKFCVCSRGLIWIQSCPKSFYFDFVDNVCKLERNAICAVNRYTNRFFTFNKVIDENNSSEEKNHYHKTHDNTWSKLYFSNYQSFNDLDPSTCIGTCPEEDPDYAVLLPNNDCKKFCMCSGGVAWVQSCPEPLYFDSVEKICKKKKDAVCGIRLYNQDSSFKIDKTFDNDGSMKTLTIENNERATYDNLDPSTCIGTCPEEDPGNAVLLPNDDCKKFCMCSGGVAWVQSCPDPLYFDSVQKICKKKKQAVCGVRSYNQDSIFMIDKTVNNDDSMKTLTIENNERATYDNLDPSTCIGTCPEEDPDYAVLLPNNDCKKFCMCSGGVAWVQSCPEPLYFDSVEKICKKKKDAVCGIRLYNQDSSFKIDKTFDNDGSMKTLTIENNERATYDNLDPSTCIGTCPEEDPGNAVLLPNDDCKKFCMCSGGVAWVQSCPDPLYFDSVQKICKKKKQAVCGVRSYNQDSIFMIDKTVNNDDSMKTLTIENNERATYDNLDPSTCIGTCPEEDPDYAVLLPNNDCKKFCMCSGGVAWVQSCPEPLYFDSVEKICKKKKDAVCGIRLYNQDSSFKIDKTFDNDGSMKILTIENNERATYDNLDPSTCIGTCPEEDPGNAVLLPNDDCKKFCMCSGGVAWVQSCPDPLYFDSVQKICKKKKQAVCGVRSYNQDSIFMIDKTVNNDDSMKTLTIENNERATYDNLDPSTCIGICPEEDPDYAVLLPNDDCKKFCMCSGGVAWVQSCPEPLYFDSVEKICKKKKDAVCVIRLYNQDSSFKIDKTFDNDGSMKTLTIENNERATYDNLDPSTCIGTCPEEDSDYAVLLPNDDCKKFCICSGGVAWVQSCHNSLYFNSVQKTCQRKKDAVCGVRSI